MHYFLGQRKVNDKKIKPFLFSGQQTQLSQNEFCFKRTDQTHSHYVMTGGIRYNTQIATSMFQQITKQGHERTDHELMALDREEDVEYRISSYIIGHNVDNRYRMQRKNYVLDNSIFYKKNELTGRLDPFIL
ncbi:hypothetical protein ACJX0J_020238 [Zea mays]